MEDNYYVCPVCHKAVIIQEAEDGIYEEVCPHCGARVRVLNRNGSFYSIDAEEYEATQNGSHCINKTTDYKSNICNSLIQVANKFNGLSLKNRIAICSSIISCLVISLGLYIYNLPPDIEKSMAFAEMDNVWNEFRSKNPYNYQTIGIRQFEDSSYLVIISEPSDNVKPKALINFFSEYNGKMVTKRKQLGVDGWLQDAVVAINDLDTEHFDAFVSDLNQVVYGSSYKPYYIDLSEMPEHTYYSTENLNVQISAEELRTWFIDNEEPLIQYETGVQTTLPERLKTFDYTCDLYYSAIPNFVVMVFPRFRDISGSFRDAVYKFSLDSDLLLGAIATKSFVAFIGREREIPVTELPPMRVETLFTLASTKKDELSQSYERNHFFAGKLPGGKDFAPILLSDELWHTEYGSILNVTDQMLKSWSENGLVEYETFDYPKPIDWAFDYGAIIDLNCTGELTYNWNTAGAGYEVEASTDIPYSIYAVNRTGSLPVSYIPGETSQVSETDSVYLAEEKAYDFFSSLCSPELVRVVQYASFYQICHNFGVYVRDERRSYYSINSSCLTKKFRTILDKIITEKINSSEIEDNYYQYFLSLYEGYEDEYDMDEIAVKCSEAAIEFRKDYMLQHQFLDTIRQNLEGLKDVEVQYGSGDFLTELSKLIVNPRDINYDFYNTDSENWTDENWVADYALWLNEYKEKIQSYSFDRDYYSLEQAKKDYLEENKEGSSLWIKCPTIVQSWSMRDSTYWTGGHNLSSRITPIKVDKALKPGEFRVDFVDGKKIVSVSSVDRARVTPSLLRKVERTQLNGVQKFNKRVELGIIREPREALAIGKAKPTRTVRGFDNKAQVAKVVKIEHGFELNGKKFNSVDDLFENMGTLIEDGVHEFRFENISSHDASCIMKGTESVISRSPSRFALADFNIESPQITHTDGITTVRIQSKSKAFLSLDKPGYGHIQEATLEFKVPTSRFEKFMQVLRDFFRDPQGTLNRLRLQRQLKQNGIDPAEIREFEEYKIAKRAGQDYKYINIA